MLALSDADIASRDADIPGLRILLDDEELAATLDTAIPGWHLSMPRVDYLRYKPRTYCVARVSSGSKHSIPSAYVVAYSNELRSKFAGPDHALTDDQPGIVRLVSNNLAIFKFPFDRRLPCLEATESSVRFGNLVRRAAPRLNCEGDFTGSVLRYKPERRCVMRLANDNQTVGVIKLYDSSGYQRARRAAKTIGGMDGFGWMRCLGQSERHALLIYEWCSGQEMSRVLSDVNIAVDALAAAASSLSHLHRQRTTKLPVEAAATSLNRMHAHLVDLTWIDPEIGTAATCLWTEIQHWLSQYPTSGKVPIHGDLHIDQFIFNDHTVRLIDFDRSRLANPAEDLAAIYASLIQHYLVVGGLSAADKLWNEFAGAYERAGGTVDLSRVHVLTASCLLRSLAEPFRHRQSDWHDKAWRALQFAQQLMQTSSVVRRTPLTLLATPCSKAESDALTVAYSAASDIRLVGDSAALDLRMARERLSCLPSFDGRHSGMELRAISVLRHKPGRRCIIEYQGTSLTTRQPIAILGKIDAKHRHGRHFEQQFQLWNCCSKDSHLDVVRVARPWAVIPEWNMWLQEKVAGDVSWPQLSGSAGALIGWRIARALAHFQRAEVSTDRAHGLEDELTLLGDRLAMAAATLPHMSLRIARLQSNYERLALRHPSSQPRTVHRDFYPDQVLVTGQHITIVDFDLLAKGDPALDVGNFIAHLLERSLRDAHHPDAFLPAVAAFRTEYLQCCPDLSIGSIELYTLLSLVRHIWLCANLPGRQDNLIRVLDLCEKLAQSCANQQPPRQFLHR